MAVENDENSSELANNGGASFNNGVTDGLHNFGQFN